MLPLQYRYITVTRLEDPLEVALILGLRHAADVIQQAEEALSLVLQQLKAIAVVGIGDLYRYMLVT